jgi:hypothetical protein
MNDFVEFEGSIINDFVKFKNIIEIPITMILLFSVHFHFLAVPWILKACGLEQER